MPEWHQQKPNMNTELADALGRCRGAPRRAREDNGATVAVRRIGKAVTTIIIIDRISRSLCPVCQALC